MYQQDLSRRDETLISRELGRSTVSSYRLGKGQLLYTKKVRSREKAIGVACLTAMSPAQATDRGTKAPHTTRISGSRNIVALDPV